MRSNLAWFTLYFCCGIILTRLINIPLELVYCLTLLLFAACFFSPKKDFIFKILFSCLVFSVGALLMKNSYLLPQSHISKYIFYKNNKIYTVKGFINSQPTLKNGQTSFLFSTQALQFDRTVRECSGDILVHLKETENLSYGEALILRGGISKPFKLYANGISSVMHVNIPGSVVKLRRNYGWPLRRLAYYLKSRLEEIIYQRVSSLTAGILDAMVLGEKNGIPAVVYDSMIKSGTVHILVVSGFNVGVVAFVIMLLLKVLRFRRYVRYVLTIPFIIMYCFVTGASAPVVRATIMAVFFLSGFLLKREPDIVNSLLLAALFILFIHPKELCSISFQLSFVSVAGIIFLYPALKRLFGLESIKIKPIKFIAESCLVSLSAWLGTCGFILYYFRILSPVTVLANIFIVPLATLITLSGFSLVLITLICPAFTGFLATSNELFVVTLLRLNDFFIRLPFAYFCI